MNTKLQRRTFLRLSAIGAASATIVACGGSTGAFDVAPEEVKINPTTSPVTTTMPVMETTKLTANNARVDAFFGGFITEKTPGGVVLVIANGQIVHQAAYGLADIMHKTPLSVDHAFHLASIGKQMTALSIMMLAEQGLLDYDAPLSTYLTELTNIAGTCTIRHLLQHTSGLPDYEDGIMDALLAKSDTPSNADMVAVIRRNLTLLATPGAVHSYCNVGYDLLAVVVERVSKQSFPQFLQSRIFDVLGMTRTFSLPNTQRQTHDLLALSYTGTSKKPELYASDDLDGIYGSGSVYSTIDDMAKYDAALYTDTLVSQRTHQTALEPTVLNDGSKVPYGFGLELERWNSEAYVAHSGAWLGFNGDYVRFPQRRFSVLVLLNRDYDYPDEPRIALQVAQLYLAIP